MTDIWLLALAQSSGTLQWLVPGLSAILGAALAAGTIFGLVRGDLKSLNRRMSDLEETDLESKFVTRREFDKVIEFLKEDLREIKQGQKEINESVKTIQNFILAREADDLDPDRLP